jgi:hypothetical protein
MEKSRIQDKTFRIRNTLHSNDRKKLRFFGGGLLIAGLGVSGGALGPLKNFTRKLRKEKDPDPDPQHFVLCYLRFFGGGLLIAGLGASGGALGVLLRLEQLLEPGLQLGLESLARLAAGLQLLLQVVHLKNKEIKEQQEVVLRIRDLMLFGPPGSGIRFTDPIEINLYHIYESLQK